MRMWIGFVQGMGRVTGYCTGDGGNGCSTDENRAREVRLVLIF